ncbi:MAG: MFS transporter [Rectinemataceae bacterium]
MKAFPAADGGRTAIDPGRERDFRLFVLASIFMGLGACVNSAAFNNYLRDNYALDVGRRTLLEFPRELPGFLVSLFVGVLAALGDVRIAAIAGMVASVGMFAMGWIPPVYGIMLASVFVFSAGTHIYMPLANSIGMGFARKGNEGGVLGKIQASTTSALVVGAAVLVILFRFVNLSYRTAFSVGAIFYFLAGLSLFFMKPAPRVAAARRFVVKKEYSRFYVLSVLYGARKQLFITFGPWMIVDLFDQPVSTMTLLFFIVSILGIAVKPAVGKITDRFGPRPVLETEALLTIVLCMLYAFAPELLPPGAALVVICACYVVDQASDAVSMSRAVYAKQIVSRPEDLSPTLSFGISIDHLVAMTLPVLGGLVWKSAGNTGYRWVFIGGAVVAVCSYFVSRGMAAPAKASVSPESTIPASSAQGTTK